MKKTILTAIMCIMAVIAVQAQESVTYEAWEGTIHNGKTPIQVFLEVREDGVVAGWINYPKSKRPGYVFLAGSKNQQEDIGDYISVHEYQKDGHQSGYLFLTKADEGDGYKGSWTHLDTKLDMVLDKPMSYPEKLKNQLVPASRAQIGKMYAFEYDHIAGDLRGGTAKFTIRSNEKMAYDISVYAPNLADGKGIGVLYDNVMTGVEEEANYEFHVEFFPKFCIITDIVGPDDNYYGAFTTFANIYYKVK